MSSANDAFLAQFPQSTCGVDLEARHAQQDVMATLLEYGKAVKFRPRDQQNVTRDSYQSIKSRPTSILPWDTLFYAFPVDFQPTERRMEKAGLRERCDVLVWTAWLQWQTLGINFDDINCTLMSAIIDGQRYEVREKSPSSQFGNSWLYITFGMVKG